MEVSQQFLIVVPIVVGLVQVVKMTGLDSRYAPAVSIILGIVGATLAAGCSGGTLLGGVIVGLTAAGLWSGVKATVA